MKNIPALLIFLPAFLLSNKKDDVYIDWSAEKRLTWEDFQAEPVRKTDAAALTATHLGFSYSVTSNRVSYNIICRFDKTKSWGLVKNDWILKHEQGHFDIAEIFARKLYKAVSSYKFNSRSFQKDLDAIYKKVVEEKEEFQHAYDEETNYSRNKRKQEEWLDRIVVELDQLESHASYNQSLINGRQSKMAGTYKPTPARRTGH